MEISEFGVENWLNIHEREAKYDLAQSTIKSMTINELNELTQSNVLENIGDEKLNYGWIEGSPTFKKEVSKLYQNVDPDNVLQTNGATGGNLLALYSLIEPGDHVISIYPSYQQLYDIPKSLGAEVSFWKIDEDQNWYPDIEEFKQLVQPNTKMICINNANNPTGTILGKSFLKQVVEVARSVDAYILCDEVYLPFDDSVDFAPIIDLYEKGISVNSLSKTYSVPGIRVGWTATNAELAETFRKYRDYTMICSGVINDLLACQVLKNKDKVLARNNQLISENLKIFKEWVAKTPNVSCVFPNGVSTSFIKLETSESSLHFCERILADEGVLLVPGEAFGIPGHARLGYCAPTETLKKGLAILGNYLNS